MAKAVAAALHDLGFKQGTIVARNETTGSALAKAYGFTWSADLPEKGAPLLINVTPMGMEGSASADLAFLDWIETATPPSTWWPSPPTRLS
jgi:shikimate dehydrogenase